MNDEINQLASELGGDPETVQQMVDGTLRVIAAWMRNDLSVDDLNEEVIGAALHQYAEQHKNLCRTAYLHRTEFARQVYHLIAAKAPA